MARKKRTAAAELRSDVAAELHHARETRSRRLDLSEKGLTDIPEEVFSLTGLETIDLSRNALRTIPQRLWDLPKLRNVNLIENPIDALPDRPTLLIDGGTYLRCRNQVDAKNLHLWINQQFADEGKDTLLAELRTARHLQRLTIGEWSIRIGIEYPEPTQAIRECSIPL